MSRITCIAITAVLTVSIAAFNALGDQKNQFGSKGSNTGQSKGKNQDKGSGKGQSSGKDQSKDLNKTTTGNGQVHKGPPIEALHPKNPVGPGKKPGPMHTFVKPLKNVSSNPNVGPGAKGALGTVLSGGFLSPTERQDLNEVVAGNPAKLGEEDLKAVQAALDYDALAKREEQYVKLENFTGERLTIWLHYQTFDEKQALEWMPTKPVNQDKALRYVVEPNATTYVTDGEVRIAAARARVWAESEGGHKWLAYRDRDLKLKPGEKQDVSEMSTHTLRLVGSDVKTQRAAK